jgi:transposase
MQDRDLYARILGLVDPWEVRDVQLDIKGAEVRVTVGARTAAQWKCPDCGKACAGYDTRQRSWRHLDTCQFKTILVADVPRVECSEHGVLQVRVPWSEPGSRFTALMEAVVIAWLRSLASIKTVAKQLRLSWDEVDGIVERAVARGLLRRERVPVRHLGIDETSFQRRHEYVTIVTDGDSGNVLHVADDRTRESIDAFYLSFPADLRDCIEVISMDMWPAYIASTRQFVPDAERRIAFDKFHVVSHLGKAVDEVRRAEHKKLAAAGDLSLAKTRYIWLRNSANLDGDDAATLDVLRDLHLKTGRAWMLKETAMDIWRYVRRGHGVKAWTVWIQRAIRSRLEPLKKVARMIRQHLCGIVNAMALKTTNAISESVNAKVQRIKRAACGFRNRERFRNAILFHLGGLDLYPAGTPATHTTS